MKHAGGRPPLYKTPEELEKIIEKYFQECRDNKETAYTDDGTPYERAKPLIPTIASLAVAIGMDRHTVYNYAKKDEFCHTIKKARDKILGMVEDSLMNGSGNMSGKIFLSKNYGYSDRTEVSHDVHGSLNKILQGAFFDDSTE